MVGQKYFYFVKFLHIVYRGTIWQNREIPKNMLYFRVGGKRGLGILKHTLFVFRPNVPHFNTVENCISYNFPKCWSVITT